MDKKIYTIATAHLDTVWNWDFEHVINVCLKDTLEQNFKYFEQYPEYRFNFEGAYRYELFEEYYPEKFEQLKKYIEAGKWNVTGSCYENGDVNIPSPESMFRNVIYGNLYFERKFGKRSNDIFLPDCFGFGWALPAIAEHAGLKGFSTQKLTWGSAYGVPFDIGRWYGSNGKYIYASLDAKSYCTTFKKIRTNNSLTDKLDKNVKKYDLPMTFGYHGVGDVGGAPKEPSVQTVCNEIGSNASNDIKVLSSSPTEFFDDLDQVSDAVKEKLPTYNGELVMTNHGVGSYISRAFGKRMNRKNEEIADMAERASVIAMSVAGASYPQSELEKGWKRTIAHTFHDDITGTSVQRVYQRSWNDYVLSANQLTNAYEGSSKEIIRNLDTSWTKGTAVVLCNSVEQPRMASVDVQVPYYGYKYVRVFEKNGNEVPSQVNSIEGDKMNITIGAFVPSMGYKVVDVLYSEQPCAINTGLRVSKGVLENFKYIVSIDKNGDIGSIIDKTLNDTEILRKPIRFEINKYEGTKEYVAWELSFKELNKYPWEFAEKGEQTVIEAGPVRATIKVTQKAAKSTFTYYVSLMAGCPWVSVYNEVEWREFKRALHNGFYFNVKNNTTTYDLGLGTIKRGKATKTLFEVPAQKWADLTDKSNYYGVSIFSDSKYGWMMKDEKSLRLTVLHSPKNYYRDDSVQGMLEFGLNKYGYAIYSHSGDYTNGTQIGARFFNQPATAFVTDKHEGELGSEYSFGTISHNDVIIRAIKKAENSDYIIVRVNEGADRNARGVRIKLGAGIIEACEVNAVEDEIGSAVVDNGALVFDLAPYEVKSFAVKLADCKVATKAAQTPVELPYNTDIVTFNHNRGSAVIPGINASIPGEIFPRNIECCGVNFTTGDIWGEGNNALICAGQQINTSGKKFYFIGASLYGDKTFNFKVDGKVYPVKVQAINERIGKWDLYDLAEVANIKTDKLAWECTHTHGAHGDNAAAQLYFFMYEIPVGESGVITLPDDSGLMIIAATQTQEDTTTSLYTALYDRVEGREFTYKMSAKEKRHHKKMKRKWKKTPNKS